MQDEKDCAESTPTASGEIDENKIQSAIDQQVMDWLQWGQVFDDNLASHALKLIYRLRNRQTPSQVSDRELCEEIKQTLEFYASCWRSDVYVGPSEELLKDFGKKAREMLAKLEDTENLGGTLETPIKSATTQIEELVKLHIDSTPMDDPYFRGTANGLIIAHSVLSKTEPKFVDPPKTKTKADNLTTDTETPFSLNKMKIAKVNEPSLPHDPTQGIITAQVKYITELEQDLSAMTEQYEGMNKYLVELEAKLQSLRDFLTQSIKDSEHQTHNWDAGAWTERAKEALEKIEKV